MEDFLLGPITAGIFTKEYCVEFPKERDIAVFQAMLDDLGPIDRNVELETRRAAQKLSGVGAADAYGQIGSQNLTTDGLTSCHGGINYGP